MVSPYNRELDWTWSGDRTRLHRTEADRDKTEKMSWAKAKLPTRNLEKTAR